MSKMIISLKDQLFTKEISRNVPNYSELQEFKEFLKIDINYPFIKFIYFFNFFNFLKLYPLFFPKAFIYSEFLLKKYFMSCKDLFWNFKKLLWWKFWISFSFISFKKVTKFGSNFSYSILCFALDFIWETKSFNVVFMLFARRFLSKSTPRTEIEVEKFSRSTNLVFAVSINS